MNKSEIIVYQAPDGGAYIDVTVEDESVWLAFVTMMMSIMALVLQQLL